MNSTDTTETNAIRFNLTHAGQAQAFLVAAVQTESDSEQAAYQAYRQIAYHLDQLDMAIVQERVLGSLSVVSPVTRARQKALQQRNIPTDNPITYFQGHPPQKEGLAGVIIRAVSNQATSLPQTVWDQGNACGRLWQCHEQSYLILQNIHGLESADLTEKSELQAQRMLDRADHILRQQGLDFSNVVRTWIYLADILAWYSNFNRVRNARYHHYGIMPRGTKAPILLPASTGIEGLTQTRSACAMDLFAATDCTAVRQLSNIQQMDAFQYGSAFSRAAHILQPDVSLIELSGTAAIDESGKSLFPNDVESQINCTLDKIEALIAPKGANLSDICAATVYVKRPQDAQVYRRIAKQRGLEKLPYICVVADICRDELLFEIEAEIAIPTKKEDKPK